LWVPQAGGTFTHELRNGDETMNSGARWRPTGVLVAALASAMALCGVDRPSLAQEKPLPVAEEVLDQAIEALGGKAAMEKQHTRMSKGTFAIPAAGQKGTLVSYEQAPDKDYQVIEVGGTRIESGTDGQVCWVVSPQGAKLLEGDDKALKARDSRFNAPLYWRSLYKTAECTGIENVDDHPCYRVVLTPDVGPPQTCYYDCQSYLQRRMDVTLKLPQPAPTEIRLDDYKKVDGVLFPFKIVQKTLGLEQVVTLDTIECNVTVPADRFALPEPVKALVETSKSTTKSASAAEKQ
jgi:hypothetical protein